jgi:hypothetical protein
MKFLISNRDSITDSRRCWAPSLCGSAYFRSPFFLVHGTVLLLMRTLALQRQYPVTYMRIKTNVLEEMAREVIQHRFRPYSYSRSVSNRMESRSLNTLGGSANLPVTSWNAFEKFSAAREANREFGGKQNAHMRTNCKVKLNYRICCILKLVVWFSKNSPQLDHTKLFSFSCTWTRKGYFVNTS